MGKYFDIFDYLCYTINLVSHSAYGSRLVLKGGSVLIADLYVKNRLISDIDIHCSSRELWLHFCADVENILNNNDRGYVYKVVRHRNAGVSDFTSDTLVFVINDRGHEVKMKMDMNIKSNSMISVAYSPILNMNTYDAYTMMADKIVAVSARALFRRVKDLYDIFVLCSMYNFSYIELLKHIQVKHPTANIVNMLVDTNFSQLYHAYDKYDGIRNKPDFRGILSVCMDFLSVFYNSYNGGDLVWDSMHLIWMEV